MTWNDLKWFFWSRFLTLPTPNFQTNFSFYFLLTLDSQQVALHTTSTATIHPIIGPTTTWKFTWHETPQHAPVSYHYEEGFSSPDTLTFCSISIKFSDIWMRTIDTIAIVRLSSQTIIFYFSSHWTIRHQMKMLVHPSLSHHHSIYTI